MFNLVEGVIDHQVLGLLFLAAHVLIDRHRQLLLLHSAGEQHHAAQRAVSILSGRLADPFGYGRIVRNHEGDVEAIVEEKDATPEQRGIAGAFEAAARHSSLSFAAAELNVTPSAVSKHVTFLEQELGIPLFVRGHRVDLIGPGRVPHYELGSVGVLDRVPESFELRRPG